MPFIEGISEYRIWLAANQRCLVLKKDSSGVNFTFAGEGEEDGTLVKGSSKLKLFIFVVLSLVTYLTIKLASQLRSSTTHHNHSTRISHFCFLSASNALNIWPPSFLASLETGVTIKCKV